MKLWVPFFTSKVSANPLRLETSPKVSAKNAKLSLVGTAEYAAGPSGPATVEGSPSVANLPTTTGVLKLASTVSPASGEPLISLSARHKALLVEVSCWAPSDHGEEGESYPKLSMPVVLGAVFSLAVTAKMYSLPAASSPFIPFSARMTMSPHAVVGMLIVAPVEDTAAVHT